jgi:ADP-ribosyl-[dinitrogen reductase] hydrolase
MAFAGDAPTAIDLCGQGSRTTHASPAAVDACRFFGGLLVSALNGSDKETLLSSQMLEYWQEPPLHPLIQEIALGSYKRRQPPEIRGSGYVVKALEAALWAFYHAQDFRHGCLLAVNLGDDADTTGAIFGQLGGAFYGEQGIPESWRKKLALRETIITLADQLLQMADK